MAEKAMFIIYPSCTEGGMPGSVINSMYFGCIPLITSWAASTIEPISQYGFLIETLSVESIAKTVDEAENMSDEKLLNLGIKDRDYVLNNYNLSTFEVDFKDALKSII